MPKPDLLQSRTGGALAVLALLALPDPAAPQEGLIPSCGAQPVDAPSADWTWLPQGDLFCPLAADPKAETTFVSYLRGDFGTLSDPEAEEETDIGAVGLGDSFAIFRTGPSTGAGFQLGIAAAVLTQFDLDTPSFDLINADYLVGLPLTFRRSGLSGRIRVYHQSSHLGDEFLLGREPERENLSFESVEVLLSQEYRWIRIYGGGEKFFRREPETLPPHLAHVGAELRPATFGAGRVFAALDVKLVEDTGTGDDEWTASWSARAGLEVARLPGPGRSARILTLTAQWYQGAAPYGQFYRDDIRYIGVGLSLAP